MPGSVLVPGLETNGLRGPRRWVGDIFVDIEAGRSVSENFRKRHQADGSRRSKNLPFREVPKPVANSDRSGPTSDAVCGLPLH